MQRNIIILGDCDCFYVSVERVFDPTIRKKPAIVLSNNDGCVVSSSPEAKKYGAKTGVPYFEIRKDFEVAGGVAFSANYTLYGDMSARVMKYLMDFAGEQDIELYSVDEAFIRLTWSDCLKKLERAIESLRLKILKELGISLSFCAAESKTLAKVGMTTSKKLRSRVFVFLDDEIVKFTLKNYPIGDVWGIGRASVAKLKAIGVDTAGKMLNADPKQIRKLLTVTGARTQSELQGVSCIELASDIEPKKNITTSRSFLQPLYELEAIEMFLSDHVFNASEKLRASDQVCHHMSIFLYSNHFKEDQPQCFLSAQIPLEQGEDAPNVLISKALETLRAIFKWGYEYRKCGVILNDLRPKAQQQLSLFNEKYELNSAITEAIDRVNKKFGPRKLKLMSCNKDVPLPDKAKRSKRYTTNLKEQLVVKI